MELKNYIMYKKISTLIFSFLLFTVCFSNSLEFDEDIYVEIENCELNYGSENLKEQSSKNEIYIVGHAYGKPGSATFFLKDLQIILMKVLIIQFQTILYLQRFC